LMLERTYSSKEEIETALGSVGRLRVLAVLVKDPDQCYTLYSLAKNTKLDGTKLGKTIVHLLNCGWVELVEGSSIKKYRMNLSNLKLQGFAKFLHDSGYYD
jgi:hypothetical protein